MTCGGRKAESPILQHQLLTSTIALAFELFIVRKASLECGLHGALREPTFWWDQR